MTIAQQIQYLNIDDILALNFLELGVPIDSFQILLGNHTLELVC